MKISTQLWGNSLGVRIPAPVARETNLVHGSEVDLQVEAGRIVLTPLRRVKRFNLKSLLARITPANLPSGDIPGTPGEKEDW